MVNRRNLLKLGAGLGAGIGVPGTFLSAADGLASADPKLDKEPIFKAPETFLQGGKDYSYLRGKEKKAVPSACWQCVSRCPIIGYLEDGRLTKIEGQPNSIRSLGKICAKSQAGINQLYDPDRILYPMRRVGKRGEGKWKRISWDDALDELAARMKNLRDVGEPEKFMFHYGRMKGGTSKLVSNFLSAYGTGTIGNHTSLCEGGKWTAQELTWGSHYDNWDFDNSQYVLNFGSNVFESHTNHISTAQRLIRAMVERGVRMVTFDVRLSNTAAKSTEWVPIKPGTDQAVVLAMCHVIMNEGLYEAGLPFLEFCKVTEDYQASLDDKIDALKTLVENYTPAWAEQISAVPAERIVAIAREFATKRPACVISYRGAVAHYNGNETERAIQMLAAITGNIDNPGGRCKAVAANWNFPKPKQAKSKQRVEARKLDLLDGFEGQVAFPTHHVSNQVFKRIKDGSAGRPDIYLWYCYAPVYSNGDCSFNSAVLKDESLLPFTVSINPFYDESAALADLILPDTTYLERWDCEDMVSPTQIPEYYIRQPLVPPLGEARNFPDVCIDLAQRLKINLGVKSMQDFVKKTCKKTKIVKKKAKGLRGMQKRGVFHDKREKPRYYSYRREVSPKVLAKPSVIFDVDTGVYWDWKKAGLDSEEEAMAQGFTHAKKAYKGYVGQKIGEQVYVGFPPDKLNKSGLFEIYSGLMKDKGLSPLPEFVAIPEHSAMQDDELILTTYKVNVQTHSRTMNCRWLSEIYHDNPAWINPQTAQDRGIADGDSIKVTSTTGEIETRAKVTPAVVPGVIAISHHCGHWEYGRFASGKASPQGVEDIPNRDHRWWHRNGVHPNWLIPNSPDPINGQQRWMDTVVRVAKVEPA
ncbi:MAG: molybdopterin-dependent oxidoreductase [Motiliproteus sp.]